MQKALPAEKNPTQNYLVFFKPKIKKWFYPCFKVKAQWFDEVLSRVNPM
jgi:hypothetical protein